MIGRHRREPEEPRFAQFLRALIRPATPSLLTVVWRWRYEIVLVLGVPTGLICVSRLVGPSPTAVAVTAILLSVVIWPGGVRASTDRIWCMITAHRIRVGFTETLIITLHGKIPIVLMVRAQPFGERVFVWCRGTLTPADMAEARERLAAACWATDVRVGQSLKHPNIAILDVVRRPQAE
ncbi:MAG: hypothetical protein JWL58_7358 [Streptosporangiaceae bacterium]|jgi:hypothetical protein|nr:hypothetical protein [Streptosporangiaceae bacterium]